GPCEVRNGGKFLFCAEHCARRIVCQSDRLALHRLYPIEQVISECRREPLVVGKQKISHSMIRVIRPLGGVHKRSALTATRSSSAATLRFATIRRVGIGRFSSIVSPGFHSRVRVT